MTRAAALALLGLVWLACAGWRAAPPEAAFRALPYVFAREGRVELSTCRWLLAQPIGVALAEGATPEEETALAAALGAFVRGMPELRFLRVPPGSAAVTVRFVRGPLADAAGVARTGRTVADCRLGVPGARAALVRASIDVSRHAAPDWLGRERRLSVAERTGALAHELGHALGVPGDVRDVGDPLAAELAAMRRSGERILAGEPLSSGPLRALYARPPGELLASVAVDAWRTADLDRLRRLAEARAFDGPYLRASPQVGRIFWRDGDGEEFGVLVAGLDELAADPTRLLLIPDRITREALPRRPAP